MRKREALEGPFAAEIRAKMRELGLTKLEDFADRFGLGRTTVYSLVVGRRIGEKWVKPSLDTLVKLSRALDLPIEDLLARLYPEGGYLTRTQATVPILGYVGGGPSQLEELAEHLLPVLWKGPADHLAAFKVRGNSMCAGRHPICDGDVVLVNTEDKGYPGAIVVARLRNGEYVVKKMTHGFLVSTNPEANHGPPAIPVEEVEEVVGRVVEVRSQLDRTQSHS